MKVLLLSVVLLLVPYVFGVDQNALRSDKRCGAYFPAPNGKPAECDPNGDGYCCSYFGWCGNTDYHCTCQGCINYKVRAVLSQDIDFTNIAPFLRTDGKCGADFLAPNGLPARCDPDSEDAFCCGVSGVCSSGNDVCMCPECSDFRVMKYPKVSTTPGRCGRTFPNLYGNPGECYPHGGLCCSTAGWCGTGREYCG